MKYNFENILTNFGVFKDVSFCTIAKIEFFDT